MTLPVSLLAAAAEALRDLEARVRAKHAELGLSEFSDRQTAGVRAVADLIDGMLDYHRGAMGAHIAEGRTALTFMQIQTLDNVLAALVPLVRAFLPDWNPDTEETP